MSFEKYREKVKNLLICKAKNNLAREAIIEIKEIDISIKVTDDLTTLFQNWLSNFDFISKTEYLGKGRILCIIKEEYI